ncbi:uroplakin-3b-like protein 2 [Anolis carolinensis]|uniref:uroplakin-3b-like protein 2 n=1 Tax=Anolis carolinensis TaxID=28377 RepID=UPI002F2B7DAF
MAGVSVLLLLGLALTPAAEIVSVNYTPRLASENLGGKVTASTFTLDQPRCVFNDVVNATDGIWLLVARSDAARNFTRPGSPSELPFQDLEKNGLYLTLNTAPASYPCPEPGAAGGPLTVLRVGNEVQCASNRARPDCNGPLPRPGPYRVKFLAINPDGVTAESEWSEEIALVQAQSPETIDVSPGRRSASAIAIASLLSILCAVLLAALIAALVYKYTDACGKQGVVTLRDPATITRYTTHHIYDQPGQKL